MFDLLPSRRRNEDTFKSMLKSFDDVFNRDVFSPLNENFRSFQTDITEKENAYYVEADLPGFNKEDIRIDMENNQLTIHAKRDNKNEEKDNNDKIIRQERHYGEFVRSFYVDNVKEDDITAKLEEGTLKIEIPKQAPTKPTKKKIDVE
ncbi:Hsp20/alpha crystallin family protein [Virgibacillus sp. NKC19-3]|uniref:Hsp20/alpha crystallin family protein n=1 Tax=Virgibacillus saliphilus TaxID=2831674 RepID=UPI001C9A632E|nr:Hsp20/alpha crystallin family protein [Virgibacillus sp. NKC19-3]MBY7145008.1 Hsp20/alpha crystallin family protein [Virgibacillus sp. NKC19-3]